MKRLTVLSMLMISLLLSACSPDGANATVNRNIGVNIGMPSFTNSLPALSTDKRTNINVSSLLNKAEKAKKDSSDYQIVSMEGYTMKVPKNWIQDDRHFLPVKDEDSPIVGYTILDFDFVSEEWVGQYGDIIYDGGTGYIASVNEKVSINGINMQHIIADPDPEFAEGRQKLEEYLIFNPKTSHAISITYILPVDSKFSFDDYYKDFDQIIHSIEKGETDESGEEEDAISFVEIKDLKAYITTDYCHCFDSVVLGKGEKLHIRLEAEPDGITESDLVFMYDEDKLSYTIEGIEDDIKAKTTTFNMIVEARKPGISEFDIASAYEIVNAEDDEFSCISISVHGLDSKEGKIVYITPTGEKYHFSESCAGDNSITTTMLDVEALEMKPCGKCAK